MIQPIQATRRILLPAYAGFIWFTLLAALLLELIPFGRFPAMPDWVALVLVFWCVHQPLRVGMGAGFVLGILVDVGNGSVMGQHALAYVALAFAAAALARRILWFPLGQQALHVLPMLLIAQLLMAIARLIGGAEFPSLFYFLSSFVAAALWYPLTYVLLMPQYRSLDKDETRPI